MIRYRDLAWKHDYMRDLGTNLANTGIHEAEVEPWAEFAVRVLLIGTPKTDMTDRVDYLIWLCQAEYKRRTDQIGIFRYRVRCAVRPLFEAGAGKASIEDAARRANGDALNWCQIVPVLIDEADRIRALRRRKAA